MLHHVFNPDDLWDVAEQADRGGADKRQAHLLVQEDDWDEKPLYDLHCGRHVHQEEQQHWRDHEHLLKEIQEGTQGDKMAF